MEGRSIFRRKNKVGAEKANIAKKIGVQRFFRNKDDSCVHGVKKARCFDICMAMCGLFYAF